MAANPLLDPILRHAGAVPDALFATYHGPAGEWRPVTRAAMVARAQSFAGLLRAEAAPGSVIVLIAEHGPDAHAAFLGAMMSGCVPAFLPGPSPKQDSARGWAQLRRTFETVRATLAIVPDALLGPVAACADDLPTRVISVSQRGSDTPCCDLPAADAVALLQHSSGTTGLKKGVALSYAAVAGQLAAYAPTLGDTAGMRVATWLPLYHDMGLISSFLLPMWLGLPIVSLDPFVWVADPRLLLDAITLHRATHAWLPNFAFLLLARAARRGGPWNLSGVRALISCSEPCKPAAMDAFAAAFAPHGLRPDALQTCYAMAETVFAVSQSTLGRPPHRLRLDPDGPELISNGRPIHGVSARVSATGELEVSAPFLFGGYHNNPDATAAALHGGWYRTGDLGRVVDGEVFVTGRLKDVIIVQGRNIMAHDVEAAVSRVPGVRPGRCVAFGYFSERHGTEALIVVAERDGEGDPTQAIGNAVLSETGAVCADVRMVEPGWLVKTTSGKTSRADNAQKYAALAGGAMADRP